MKETENLTQFFLLRSEKLLNLSFATGIKTIKESILTIDKMKKLNESELSR